MDSDQRSGIVCSWCGRIKDKDGGWVATAESDDQARVGALTSHGLCDDCYASIIDDFLHISKQPADSE